MFKKKVNAIMKGTQMFHYYKYVMWKSTTLSRCIHSLIKLK